MKNDEKLKIAVKNLYDAVSTGDRQYLEKTIASEGDVFCIGTDSNEFWNDRSLILENLVSQSESGVKIASGNINAYSEGSVGWAVDEPKFVFTNGTEVSIRMTLIFHLENENWTMLQAHCSLGVPNSELLNR